MRLYRIENTRRARTRPVNGLTGRWFSPDAAYIESQYGFEGAEWVYVDLPDTEADNYSYRNMVKSDPNLYGVEDKDYILPLELLDLKQKCEKPPEANLINYNMAISPPQITELTSNVAQPGRVLEWNRKTGCISVVKAVDNGMAFILTKNKAVPETEWHLMTVPVRKVKRKL